LNRSYANFQAGRACASLATHFGEHNAAQSPVSVAGHQSDETVALQRSQVVPEGRTVRHERVGQLTHRGRSIGLPVQFVNDRVLGRAQSGRRQSVVVKLGHPPRGLTHCRCAALTVLV
jgi:hypothetical protein